MKYTRRLIESIYSLSLKIELFIKYKGNKNGRRFISNNLSAVFCEKKLKGITKG